MDNAEILEHKVEGCINDFETGIMGKDETISSLCEFIAQLLYKSQPSKEKQEGVSDEQILKSFNKYYSSGVGIKGSSYAMSDAQIIKAVRGLNLTPLEPQKEDNNNVSAESFLKNRYNPTYKDTDDTPLYEVHDVIEAMQQYLTLSINKEETTKARINELRLAIYGIETNLLDIPEQSEDMKKAYLCEIKNHKLRIQELEESTKKTITN